ncbi:MAG: SPOR domain-containing protein [Ideonella sp.]|nr:SPOR domain-containing protein [Ideonella sp.]
MLRGLVIALLIANLVFWAWKQPAIAQALGLPQQQDREPERLLRQIRPELMQLIPPPSAEAVASGVAASAPANAAVASAAAPSTAAFDGQACLEVGPLNPPQISTATRALQQAGVAPGGWAEIRRDIPGRWVIAMGRFESREQLQRKLAELQRLQLKPQEATGTLAPGLILGEFSSTQAAQERLTQLKERGVRTARVVSLAEGRVEVRLRADQLSPTALSKLRATTAADAALRWRACEE